eukprot:548501_1
MVYELFRDINMNCIADGTCTQCGFILNPNKVSQFQSKIISENDICYVMWNVMENMHVFYMQNLHDCDSLQWLNFILFVHTIALECHAENNANNGMMNRNDKGHTLRLFREQYADRKLLCNNDDVVLMKPIHFYDTSGETLFIIISDIMLIN